MRCNAGDMAVAVAMSCIGLMSAESSSDGSVKRPFAACNRLIAPRVATFNGLFLAGLIGRDRPGLVIKNASNDLNRLRRRAWTNPAGGAQQGCSAPSTTLLTGACLWSAGGSQLGLDLPGHLSIAA